MDDLRAIYFQLFPAPPRKGDQRKMQLVEVCIRQNAQSGLQSLSLDSLGKELGIRRSHVVYYFPTIEAVILEAAKFITAIVQHLVVKKVKESKSDREGILAILEANLEWMTKFPDQPRMMFAFLSYTQQEESFRMLYQAILNGGKSRIQAILKDDTPARASEIQDFLTGLLVNISSAEMLPPSRRTKRECREKFEELLGRMKIN